MLLLEGPQASSIGPYGKSNVALCRNDADRGQQKYSDKKLSQLFFAHHISHGLTCDRTRAFALKDRHLPAWATARVLIYLI
jgi:hypothetical protein